MKGARTWNDDPAPPGGPSMLRVIHTPEPEDPLAAYRAQRPHTEPEPLTEPPPKKPPPPRPTVATRGPWLIRIDEPL